MRIEIDDNKRVVQWSVEDMDNELLFDVPESVKIPADFEENAWFYRYENDQFVFDPEYKEQYEKERKVADIRQHREEICFPVINRGQAWYMTLDDKKLKELTAWYQAWLDATETLKEPEMPSWLKGVN